MTREDIIVDIIQFKSENKNNCQYSINSYFEYVLMS